MAAEMAAPWQRWVLFSLGACLLAFWALRITDAAIDKDAGQNLQLAINLAHHGIVSENTAAPYRPSMVREPLPVFITAGLIRIGDALRGRPDSDKAYFAGDRAKLLKFQNLFWLGVLIASLFVAIKQFTQSYWAACAAVVLLHWSLLEPNNVRYLVDSLYTEAPAAALLTLGSWLFVRALFQQHWPTLAMAGVVFGLLALVKAVFLYVFAGVLLVAAIAIVVGWIPGRKAIGLFKLLMLLVVFAATITPWMARNQHQMALFAITERGGEVLYTRAIKDRMSSVEIRGAMGYWARWPVSGALRRLFGFTPRDFEAGGRLQHLNRSADSSFGDSDLAATIAGRPDLAVSYYRQATAEKTRLRLMHQQQGRSDYEIQAGRELQDKAMKMIIERPIRHLAMTPLFLWRGAFFTFPVLVFALIFALKKRRFEQALFLVPTLGAVLFYGLFSHYIPRYSLPMIPITVLAAVMVCVQFLRARRVRPTFSN